MISCPCVAKGRPYCGSCTPNERSLAELEAALTPRSEPLAEDGPRVVQEENADG